MWLGNIDVFGPIAKKAGALTRHDGATTRRSHAGQRPMRRGIGRQDYSNKLKIARSRSGIPDHSCPPPSPSLPPLPPVGLTPTPPPLLSWLTSKLTLTAGRWGRVEGGREERGRGVTWLTTEELVVRKNFRRADVVIPA